jgi:hypothetical protein
LIQIILTSKGENKEEEEEGAAYVDTQEICLFSFGHQDPLSDSATQLLPQAFTTQSRA